MNSVAVVLLALALILDLLPILSAARWDREDRSPPSAIPVVPLLLYSAACAIWKQTAQVRLLGLGVLTVLHVTGLAFVARRRVHWLAERQKRTPRRKQEPAFDPARHGAVTEWKTAMLDLDSPEWNDLRHAYGRAGDIPQRLRHLATFPASVPVTDEPWGILWSSLCHQGAEVYPASFAAVPHIVQVLSLAPERASFNFFLLPAAIEVARVRKNVPVPEHLAETYFSSLAQLPGLAGSAARPGWDPDVCQSALAATAAATGQHVLAELLIELGPSEIPEALEWLYER